MAALSQLPRVDIGCIEVDQNANKTQRLQQFVEAVGNPYQFIVDGTPVDISFSGKSSLQSCIEKVLLQQLG